ncbi:hypothetical protein AAIR98_000921 [Elusimicrobium simillimum]|uniref:D-Ala-D-Ala carboxypeptidase family metallohydrolase n=1 Tax=Elusimicrobium simillimum TaxID=3143438 RepID=UPI003C6ED2F6
MIENKQITKHFSFYELTTTANTDYLEKNRQYGFENMDKVVSLAHFAEQVRSILGVPMIVTSGGRCPELNKAINGSPTSQHFLWEAIDFIPKNMSVAEAFDLIRGSNLQFGQLILERAGIKEWVHISMPGNRSKERQNMVLIYLDGKYTQVKR